MENSKFNYSKYAWIIFLGLLLLHCLSGYPGGMTSDSTAQFKQGLTSTFVVAHPPLMSILWSLLNHIYIGPQSMLFLHFITVAFCITNFFTTMAEDYRYYYFVRISSFFGLPIFLKLSVSSKAEAA